MGYINLNIKSKKEDAENSHASLGNLREEAETMKLSIDGSAESNSWHKKNSDPFRSLFYSGRRHNVAKVYRNIFKNSLICDAPSRVEGFLFHVIAIAVLLLFFWFLFCFKGKSPYCGRRTKLIN